MTTRGVERRVILILILGLVASLAWAGQPERSLLLRWDASTTPDASYRLYYGEAPGTYTVVLETGFATSASVGGLKPGELYYFACTAVNAWGESPYSNEVSARGRP